MKLETRSLGTHRTHRVALPFTLLIAAACGGGGAAPPKTADKPVETNAATPAVTPASTATSTEPATATSAPPPAAEPTALSDDEKKRDQALVAKLAPYVDAYANVDAQLSKDRKKVLFRSNRDGLWKPYIGEVGKPAAEPKKLADTTERVTFAAFTPDSKWVLYTSDTGADEQFAIWKVAPDGTGATNLTPGEKLRRDPPVFARLRANQIAFSARALKESGSRVYTQDLAGGEPKAVYQEEGQVFAISASPDGQHVLLLRQKSASDSVLLRLDVDSGKATRLYPREGGKSVTVSAAAYSGDGKRVYLATDDGQEGANIVAIEGSGIISGRYKDEVTPTAQIDTILASPKDDRIAIVANAGNHSEVRILDAKSLKLQRTVKSPVGVIQAGEFADDGASFTVRLGTPDKPTDVYDVDAAAGTLKPLRTDVRPGLKDAVSLDATIDKAPAFDGLSIPLNVYLPKNHGKTLPVIVDVHGGPSSSSMAGYNPIAAFFVSQGYAWVQPNIRGSSGFGRAYEMADNKDKRGDALKDLESVNTWVKAQPWCDDDRVVVLGGSYGGYMVLMALTRQPTLWRAGVDYVGVSSLSTLMQNTSGVIRAVLTDEFGDLDKEKDLLEKWSPLKDMGKVNAPLFVYQGQNDPRVPRSEADQVVNALRTRKVPVEYMVAMNEGHSIDRRETKLELYSRIVRFLADQTKAPPQTK
jgi:dipeptidyl aminopeptidase/acylaminoacyl peptidase